MNLVIYNQNKKNYHNYDKNFIYIFKKFINNKKFIMEIIKYDPNFENIFEAIQIYDTLFKD